MSTPSNPRGWAVVDASTIIAICAKEAGRQIKAEQRLEYYGQQGLLLYAPGVMIAETLYVLCVKHQNGLLTSAGHDQALQTLQAYAPVIAAPPFGDRALIKRAEEIRSGYGCSRSADGLYLALAEELSATGTGELLTFDQDMPKQAAQNAPTVMIHLLT